MKPVAGLDPQTQQLLRALGETALRLAEGQPVDDQLTHDLLASAPTPTNPDRRALLTIAEACERLRISRWSFYELLHRNQLRTVTIGRRRFVPSSELTRFLGSLSTHGALT